MINVLRVHFKNAFNRYIEPPKKLALSLPLVISVSIRNFLQKYDDHITQQFFLEDIDVTSIHHKHIVSKYTEEDYGRLSFPVISVADIRLRNVLQKTTTEPEKFSLNVVDDFAFSGTNKPYITHPELSGVVNLGQLFTVPLSWTDESITHLGYEIYRDIAPITDTTSLTPIASVGRDVFTYTDETVEEGTEYYYRVAPKSSMVRKFSNLLNLFVPLYLRAPHTFQTHFLSLSKSTQLKGKNYSLSKIIEFSLRFLSYQKPSEVRGFHADSIFTSTLNSRYFSNTSSTPTLVSTDVTFLLRNPAFKIARAPSTHNGFIEYFPDYTLSNFSGSLIKVPEPEKLSSGFLGITKAFIRGAFVILGSAIENRYGIYDSITEVLNQKGFGTREMMLRNPEAFLLVDGKISALAGYYQDDISLRTSKCEYTVVADFSNIEVGPYFNPSQIRSTKYTLNPIEGIWGDGAYQNEVHTRLEKSHYFNTGIDGVAAQVESTSGIQNPRVYCILGSNTYGLDCRLVKEFSPYDVLTQWSSLDLPRRVRTSIEEDQEFTLFSGYLPPVGYPMGYDTYEVGNYVIPVFQKQVIPGDMTRFTIYEKMFKSKEVTSGYRPPNGVGIRFSLFVDEE